MKRAAFLLVVGLFGGLIPVARAQTPAPPASFKFDGRGFGHQVGASQYGMKGQADEGRTYKTILGHYYSGTTVESRTPPPSVRIMLKSGMTEFRVSGDGGRFEFRRGGPAGEAVATNESGSGTWTVRSDASKQFTILRPDGSTAAGPLGSGAEPLALVYIDFGTIVDVRETGNRYKWGHIELDALDGSQLRAVAVLSMQRYLRGIGEVPSSWHMEALKAQVVAARSYAQEKAERLGHNRSGCNCTLFGDTRDQAYVGYDKEDPASFGGSTSTASRWPSAVDATVNEVSVNSSGVIQALYSSSAGGRTENNEDVFGGSPLPYLRSVDDHWSQGSDNPFATWTTTMSQSEVAQKLGLTSVTTIDLSSRTAGGGVKTASVTGDTSLSMTGERFRSRLGLRSIKVEVTPLTTGSSPAPGPATPQPTSIPTLPPDVSPPPGFGDLTALLGSGGFGGFGGFNLGAFGSLFGLSGAPGTGTSGGTPSFGGFGNLGALFGPLFGGFGGLGGFGGFGGLGGFGGFGNFDGSQFGNPTGSPLPTPPATPAP